MVLRFRGSHPLLITAPPNFPIAASYLPEPVWHVRSTGPGRYQEIIITTSTPHHEGSTPSASTISSIPTAAATASGFAALGLAPELLRAVAEQGYTDPTPIQAQAIPSILAGRDLLGAAQTGTGKTAGFTLPMLQRLSDKAADRNPRRPVRALVLVPTRELAAQVQDSIRTYGKHLRLTSTTIYGGVGFHPQVQALRRGVDIVVATPGRLLDHIQQRTLDLRNIEILVLDEADRMLDMGFIHDIRKIHALLPKERHTLLFSATFSNEIRTLSAQFLRDPVTVEVARRNAPIELVTQVVHLVDKDKKRELLAHLVKSNDWRQVLVFCKTKHGADRLAEQLGRDGIDADAIHGNKSQPQRMRALKRFKDAELQVLVATDIAARGIDIDSLPHVVNYDLPNVSEDYVHRIGRTGRAGSTGDAISLVCAEDRSLLLSIERLINKRIDQVVIPGFEPTQSFARAPSNKPARRNTGGGGYGDRRPSGSGAPRRSGPPPRPGRSADSRKPGDRRDGPAPARRDGPAAAPWEAEREAQRKHFSQNRRNDGKPAQEGRRPAPALLGRKAA